MVLLNFKEVDATFEASGAGELNNYQLVLANYDDTGGKGDAGRKLIMRGYEGRVYLKI